MKILNEFVQYLSAFNPFSKTVIKASFGIVFIIYLFAMYFALAAGRTADYYLCMNIFEVLTDNAKSVLGIGMFIALLFEGINATSKNKN